MPILIVLVLCFGIIWSSLDTPINHNIDTIKVSYEDILPTHRKQIQCLAENIYFEAGREPEEGKIAVAMVTLNRVNHQAWPDTICGVVREKNSRVCQFSWWCEPHNYKKAITKTYTPQEKKLYLKAKDVAVYVYTNYDELKKNDITKNSLFYHANYVSPGWNYKKTVTIGTHIFYTTKT